MDPAEEYGKDAAEDDGGEAPKAEESKEVKDSQAMYERMGEKDIAAMIQKKIEAKKAATSKELQAQKGVKTVHVNAIQVQKEHEHKCTHLENNID